MIVGIYSVLIGLMLYRTLKTYSGFIRDGIATFFDNANYPLAIINQFLQGKVEIGFQDSAAEFPIHYHQKLNVLALTRDARSH